MCFWADGWAGLSFAPAGDSHTGVAVGTYVYPVAAMSFGQALTLPSFSTMVAQRGGPEQSDFVGSQLAGHEHDDDGDDDEEYN